MAAKTMKKQGITLRCKRKDCRRTWVYTGTSKFWATCPRCYNKVNVAKCKVTMNTTTKNKK